MLWMSFWVINGVSISRPTSKYFTDMLQNESSLAYELVDRSAIDGIFNFNNRLIDDGQSIDEQPNGSIDLDWI